MDYKDLTNILMKVVGAIIIAYTIVGIPTYIAYYFAQQEESLFNFLLLSMVPMVIPLLLGALLFTFPNAIANRIIKKSDVESSFDSKELEMVAFAVLGMYLLFNVVSDLFFHLVSLYLANTKGLPYDTGADHPYALIIATLAELAFALYLLLGSKSLVAVLRSLRTMGTDVK